MNPELKSYLDAIFNQRDWSWAVAGMVYFIPALILRGWFLNPVRSRARDLSKKHSQDFKKAYLNHAWLGWLFFLIPLAVVIWLWTSGATFPFSQNQTFALAGGAVSFILSVLFHLTALGMAAVDTLKNTEGSGDI